MNCSEVRENIFRYIDNDLSSSEREGMKKHLGSCPDCRREYEKALRLQDGLAKIERFEPDAIFMNRLKARMEKEGIAGKKATLIDMLTQLVNGFVRRPGLAFGLSGVVLVLIAFLIIIRFTGPGGQDMSISLAYCDGNVSLIGEKSGMESVVSSDSICSLRDIIKTGDNSRAVIVIRKKDTKQVLADVRLDGNSQFSIESLQQDTGSAMGRLSAGRVWIEDEKSAAEPVLLSCRTATVEVSPMGTVYQVAFRKGETQVSVSEGKVGVQPIAKPEMAATVEAGYMISIDSAMVMKEPKALDGIAESEWEQWNAAVTISGSDLSIARPSPAVSATTSPTPEKIPEGYDILLKVGDVIRFNPEGDVKPVKWDVSGEIGTINQDGLFVATGVGNGEVTAISEKGSATVKVTIVAYDSPLGTFSGNSYTVAIPKK